MSKCSVLGVKIAWQSINLRVVGRYSWIPFSLRNVLEKNFTVNKFKNVTDVLKNLLLKIDIWEFDLNRLMIFSNIEITNFLKKNTKMVIN